MIPSPNCHKSVRQTAPSALLRHQTQKQIRFESFQKFLAKKHLQNCFGQNKVNFVRSILKKCESNISLISHIRACKIFTQIRPVYLKLAEHDLKNHIEKEQIN